MITMSKHIFICNIPEEDETYKIIRTGWSLDPWQYAVIVESGPYETIEVTRYSKESLIKRFGDEIIPFMELLEPGTLIPKPPAQLLASSHIIKARLKDLGEFSVHECIKGSATKGGDKVLIAYGNGRFDVHVRNAVVHSGANLHMAVTYYNNM